MVVKNRDSGIKVLGTVPWGAHICLLFDTKRDLITTTLLYIKAGLENNESCLWITSDSPGIKKVGDIIKKKTPYFSSSAKENQIDILPFTSVGAKAGELDLLKLHWIMADRLKRAIDTGYDGLRVAFDLSWAEKAEWKKMTAQLTKCRKTNGKFHMLAFFAYPLDKCGAKEYINLIGDGKYGLIINNGKMVQLKDLCARMLTEKYNNIQNLSKNLHEAEERFRKAARASPDIISITTLDKGKFLYVNDNFLRFHGYTRDEVIGRTVIELNLLKNIKHRENMIERVKRQGRIQNGESILRSKSGEISKVKYSNELHVIKGQPCIITVFTDITALKKKEEKEQAIINTAIDGFCITDINGKILEANESYCQMVGYTRDELLRMSVKDLDA